MRIIAGQHRGLALAAVGKGDPRARLRPTSDRVRENLFNLLTGGRFGQPLDGARVLDLFSGTGALGLEALSRGASHVTFVEHGSVARALITKNIALMKAEDRTRLIRRDATRLPPNDGTPCDLAFLDPPYAKGLGAKALAAALRGDWLKEGALVIWEDGTPETPPQGLTLLDRRRYGDTHVMVLACGPSISSGPEPSLKE